MKPSKEDWHESLNLILESEDSEEMQLQSLHNLVDAACEGACAAADELMTEFISKTRASKWDVINDGLYKANKAIATYRKAKKEEKAHT